MLPSAVKNLIWIILARIDVLSLPEQIDNSTIGVRKGKYERYQKRRLHRHNRDMCKRFLRRHEDPPSTYKKFKGYTI